MSITAGSTEPHEERLRRRLPPDLLAEVHDYYNELQRKDAELVALVAAPVERMANAQAVPIANCRAREALVQQAIDNTRANLEAEPERARVKRIWQHLDDKKETLGYVFDELPTRKVVKRVLKRNGL